MSVAAETLNWAWVVGNPDRANAILVAADGSIAVVTIREISSGEPVLLFGDFARQLPAVYSGDSISGRDSWRTLPGHFCVPPPEGLEPRRRYIQHLLRRTAGDADAAEARMVQQLRHRQRNT